MGIAVLISLIVLIVGSIVINVLGIVRDRRSKKKNKGVYMLQKKIEEYARLSGRSANDVASEYLQKIEIDIQHLDDAQSGGGINT